MAHATQQTDSRQRTSPERTKTRSQPERTYSEQDAARQALAFRAILEGGAAERLPAALTERAASRVGNQAMLSLLSRAKGGGDRAAPVFPAAAPAVEASEWTGGGAISEPAAPAFSALAAW